MATAVSAPSVPPKRTWREAALGAWNSPRAFARVLLAVAVVIGALLRFSHLTRADIDGDEGATWASASAHSLQAVVAAEQRIEALGKLPLYHVLLHIWIRIFGDSLFSMRALSAGLGTLAIVLIFAAVREVCICLADDPAGGAELGEVAGAFAALIFATNVTMVLVSRMVRMYPLVMSAEFAQILFFVRAQRRGGLLNYAGVAIFTALMVAANFSASFLLGGEGLWLAALLLARWARATGGGLAIFRPGFAVLAGLVLLAPWLIRVGPVAAQAVHAGWLDFIRLRSMWWPYTAFRVAIRRAALFYTLVGLGLLGLWRSRRSAPRAAGFLAAWMVGPMLAMLGVTYLVHSLEVQRYVLIAFAGLFALAALGAASFHSGVVRLALAVLLAVLSIRPAHHALNHLHYVEWREAVGLALRQAAPGERIVVIPSYAVYAARYYFPRDRRADAVGLDGCGPERIAIFSGWWWLPAEMTTKIDACYPRVIRHLPMVEVRSR